MWGEDEEEDVSSYWMSLTKLELHPKTGHEIPNLYYFFNLGSRWGGCSTSRPGRFTPGKEPVPIV